VWWHRQAPGKDINHTVDMSTGHKLLHIVVLFLVVTTPLTVLVVLFFTMRHVLKQYGCAPDWPFWNVT